MAKIKKRVPNNESVFGYRILSYESQNIRPVIFFVPKTISGMRHCRPSAFRLLRRLILLFGGIAYQRTVTVDRMQKFAIGHRDKKTHHHTDMDDK